MTTSTASAWQNIADNQHRPLDVSSATACHSASPRRLHCLNPAHLTSGGQNQAR
ncbi:hypothetical protein [Streptomyces sp. NPDC050416]|uniref:hypothetical protein n=1 Tax=Streptomyces sp. NPDC050416 TaxID=3365611 RepID=UPI0037ADF87D